MHVACSCAQIAGVSAARRANVHVLPNFECMAVYVHTRQCIIYTVHLHPKTRLDN